MGLLRKTLSILYATRSISGSERGRTTDSCLKQDLSVSIDFDHVVKFCIQDDVDGPPFRFYMLQDQFLAVNVDGRQIPAKPLQPDFENAGYIRSYMGLYQYGKDVSVFSKALT
jgi:hypothetical protein